MHHEGRGGIAVRAHNSCAESLRLKPESRPLLNARSLFTQQQMGTWWQHLGDKGGEERTCPPYLTCQWLRINFLSNWHSPTYENIRDYLLYTMITMEALAFMLQLQGMKV